MYAKTSFYTDKLYIGASNTDIYYLNVCAIFMNDTPFSYMLCLLYNKLNRELNLEGALDKDIGVVSFCFCSTGPDSCFWEFHPSSLTLGVCES